MVAIEKDRLLFAAVLFSMGLNYKQLELYHALPFFAFLLGTCFREKNEIRIWKLFKISAVVFLTFAIIWLPFLNGIQGVVDVLNRLFPFQRGLYEVKINFSKLF